MAKFLATFLVGRSYYIELIEAPSLGELRDLLARRDALSDHEKCLHITPLEDWLKKQIKFEDLKVMVEKLEAEYRAKNQDKLSRLDQIYQLYAQLKQSEQSEVLLSLNDWYDEWYQPRIQT